MFITVTAIINKRRGKSPWLIGGGMGIRRAGVKLEVGGRGKRAEGARAEGRRGQGQGQGGGGRGGKGRPLFHSIAYAVVRREFMVDLK